MPVFEFMCASRSRLNCETKFERFLWHHTDANPPCETCGGETKRLVSRFNAPWTGSIDRFNQPGLESHNACPDGGHWAYKVNSSRLIDKNGRSTPEPVLIQNRADQVRFCREENLHDPADLNPNHQSEADGMTSSPQGLPGSWV